MRFALLLPLALALGLSASVAHATGTSVVVIASKGAAPTAESLARAVYSRAELRPRLDESEVDRLLGGDLGESLRAPQPITSYLRDKGIAGAVVVDRIDHVLRARLLVARRGTFETVPLQLDEKGEADGATLQRIESTLGQEDSDSKKFYSSPWFWGAIGGAALIGLVIFASTSQSDSVDHSRLVVRLP